MDGFPLLEVDDKIVSSARQYRRRQRSLLPVILGGIAIAGFAAVAWMLMALARETPEPAIKPLPDVYAQELREFHCVTELEDPQMWDNNVVFELVKGPPGAQLDAATGTFRWKPGERDGPGRFKVVIRARAKDDSQKTGQQSFWINVLEQNQKPRLAMPAETEVRPGETLAVTVQAEDPDEPAAPLSFSLVQGPTGAKIDPVSGKLSWTAGAELQEQTIRFVVRVREERKGGASGLASFQVHITRPPRPVDHLLKVFAQRGLPVDWKPGSYKHSFSGTALTLLVAGEELRVIEYESSKAARSEAMRIATHREEYSMPDLPDSWVGPIRYHHLGDLLVIYGGLNEEFHNKLVGELGRPLEMSAPKRSRSAK